ncbi:MAG: ATP-binding protein [Bauldia sp.]
MPQRWRSCRVISRRMCRRLPRSSPQRRSGTLAFERFADALPDPCFILDRRGVVRYANERGAATFQIRVGEALTFRLRVPDLVAAFDRVAKGGPPARVEFAERVPTERWFAAWFARLEGSEFVILLVDDLSEQRKADRVRVDFVANASHELRTPLASLAGFIETLQGPAREDTAARTRFLAIMREQAERMSRLVNDLLSLSRIEMKAHVRPSDRIDLIAVVNHVVDSLEPLARELGVVVETDMPATVVEVTGDRDELTQVFENLIENACKYGQGGKRVTVTVTAPQEGGGAQVAVRDFGPGIPEEHLPRLTERFYRVDVEDSRRHRGTGLGLAIVKHIVARHLARLTVVSRLGEGAIFTVAFPATLPPRAPVLGENGDTDQRLASS